MSECQHSGLIARAVRFHPWDAMAAPALEAIASRGPFRNSAETGCGGSTILLSRLSQRHTTFAIEGENQTITRLREHPDLRRETVIFVEGETRRTLPLHYFEKQHFEDQLDIVLLDGPHAYPLPQLEFVYLFPHVRPGGWIVLDDIQIPAVHQLFRFMTKEPSLLLEEVKIRTAFFRKLRESGSGPDDWQLQGINKRPILRYSWRDRLRRLLRPAR